MRESKIIEILNRQGIRRRGGWLDKALQSPDGLIKAREEFWDKRNKLQPLIDSGEIEYDDDEVWELENNISIISDVIHRNLPKKMEELLWTLRSASSRVWEEWRDSVWEELGKPYARMININAYYPDNSKLTDQEVANFAKTLGDRSYLVGYSTEKLIEDRKVFVKKFREESYPTPELVDLIRTIDKVILFRKIPYNGDPQIFEWFGNGSGSWENPQPGEKWILI